MDILLVNKRWDDLVKLITPLDLVLFAGKDFVSSTIRKLQNKKLQIGDFSHVGVVVSSDILPHVKQLQPGEWYVWESTSSLRLPGFENEVPDVFGNHKLGVQIRNLKKVLDIYNGDIYIAKLKNNPLYMGYQLVIDVPTPKSSEPQSPFSKELQELIDDLRKKEPEKAPEKQFDEIIEDINHEIDTVEKMLKGENIQPPSPPKSETQVENESPKGKTDIASQDSLDVSMNNLMEKMSCMMKDIHKTMDDTLNLTKEIEKDLDEICVHINRMINDKFKDSKNYKKVIKEIRYIYEIYGNKFYNASILDLLSALYPVLRPFRNLKYKILRGMSKLFKNKKIEPNALFCSQFVAIIYSRLGIIDKNIDIKNFVPVDFLGCDEDGQKNIVSNIFKIIK